MFSKESHIQDVMKTLSFFIIALVFPLLAYPQSGYKKLIGVWLTSKKDSKVEITYNPSNGTYSGKLVWVASPNEKLTGEQILKNVTYQKSSGNFICPWIYDPRLNVQATGIATVSGDTLYIKARKGFISKTEIFTRVP